MIVTVVGNYPRTILNPGGASLRRAWTQHDRGQIDEKGLHAAQDEFTLEILKEQAEAGLDVVTDGQVRWDDGQTYWARGIFGFTINGLIRHFDTNTYYRQPVLESAVQWRQPISTMDYRFAVGNSNLPVKATITGPYTLAKLSVDQHYGDLRAFTMALAAALNQEARALEPLGPHLIQFNEPAIVRPGNKGDLPLFREAMSVLTEGLTAKTALYTFFGDVDGLLPEFYSLPFDVIGLDFWMGPRNWDLLEGFPEKMELGLGIVDARNTKLETVEQITSDIRRASEHVSLDRIHVNPSCGLEFLPRDKARVKLFRMAEGVRHAREVLE